MNNATGIIGNWRYTSSTTGSGNTVQTGYDSTFATSFADTLQFTDSGIVYYKYLGITTWSNYKVPDLRLILIGGVTRDTFVIHELNETQLQIGKAAGSLRYKATFLRY